MKKLGWALLLIVVLFVGLVVSSIQFDSGAEWSGAYGASSASGVGAIAPNLDVPFLRGDGDAFAWMHDDIGQVSPCTVAFFVDANDSATQELFVPHASGLVALAPDAVHIVWASEQGDDAWLPESTPGVVVQIDAAMPERFGLRRVPSAVLVNARGAIMQRGFPTEVDIAAVAEVHRSTRRSRHSGRRALNQVEPILYRDGDDEKVAVRVIPESMDELVSARSRHRDSLTSVSVSITQPSLEEMVNALKRRDGKVRVPADLEATAMKVDAWISGVTIGENSAMGLARETAYAALLEALELEETTGIEDVDGYALRLDGDFLGESAPQGTERFDLEFDRLAGQSVTLSGLASTLQLRVSGPIAVEVDRDVGSFDIDISWTRGDVESLNAALVEALGVSLVPARVRADVLVLKRP